MFHTYVDGVGRPPVISFPGHIPSQEQKGRPGRQRESFPTIPLEGGHLSWGLLCFMNADDIPDFEGRARQLGG
jgi:hypothetical protein